MNLLGKILTAIILVLSLVFMTTALFVGATQKNWKKAANEVQLKLNQLQEINSSLEDEVSKNKDALAKARFSSTLEIAQLQSRLTQYQADLRQKEEELNEKNRQATAAIAQNKQLNDRVTELDGDIKDLRDENVELTSTVTDLHGNITSITDKNYSLQADMVNLEEKAKTLETVLAKATGALRKLGGDLDSSTAHIEPKIAGEITEAGKTTFVLSLGKDDGIRVGHRVEVYNREKYLGTLRVTSMNNGNRAVAQLITKPRGQIRAGYTVKTPGA